MTESSIGSQRATLSSISHLLCELEQDTSPLCALFHSKLKDHTSILSGCYWASMRTYVRHLEFPWSLISAQNPLFVSLS